MELHAVHHEARGVGLVVGGAQELVHGEGKEGLLVAADLAPSSSAHGRIRGAKPTPAHAPKVPAAGHEAPAPPAAAAEGVRGVVVLVPAVRHECVDWCWFLCGVLEWGRKECGRVVGWCEEKAGAAGRRRGGGIIY